MPDDDITAIMHNLTISIALPPNQYHSSAKTLLGMPLELREKIYRHALVTPPKHSLSHLATCPFRQNHTKTSIEPAAGMVLKPRIDLSEDKMLPWWDVSECCCAKRTGLNLLCASRQVHEESKRIFWSENLFCFQSEDEFVVCVGEMLRPRYRRLLRRVYVASPDPWKTCVRSAWNAFDGGYVMDRAIPRWCQFWGVLNQCSGLRYLAVRPEVVRRDAAHVANLRKHMPHLRALELTFVAGWKDAENGRWERDWGNFRACGGVQRETVFARAEMAVDLAGPFNASACKEVYRTFTTNFCVYVERIVRERFLGLQDGEDVDLHHGKVLEGLNDERTDYEVRLPTGKTAWIRFMAVPQSKRTRLALVKVRAVRDYELRKSGRPTEAEGRAVEVGKQRRIEKRERDDERDRSRCEAVLVKKRLRDEIRAGEERKKKDDAREEVKKAMEETKEIRKSARKKIQEEEVFEAEEYAEAEVEVEVEPVEEAQASDRPKTPKKPKISRKRRGLPRGKRNEELQEFLAQASWGDEWHHDEEW
ncbi:hypothetical protein CTRI78_v006740 [Colletotrichum trifolii]|uniref:DUF7730 domain-containing protein n=1 Tax=Colletotrichum trifolii TaxID=5466 RepID=A0A4V3HVX7_COLTR|nr:hypothetical protein CTRI78_v006740 [Colletotrichum trifolii]